MLTTEQKLKPLSLRRMRRNHVDSNNAGSFRSLCKLIIVSVLTVSILFPNYVLGDFVVEEIESELTEGDVALNRWKRLLQDEDIKEENNDGNTNAKSVAVQPVDEETGSENPKYLEETINKESDEPNYYEKYQATYNNSDPKYGHIIEETNQYYCEKYGQRHLLCALKENVEDRKYVERFANDSDIDFILRFITRLRKRLLMGKEDGASPGVILPKASKMRRIQWSQELQIFAQRISNQCEKNLDDDLVISTDDIPTLTTVIGYSENSENRKPTWIHVLMQWYKGVKNVEQDILFKPGKKMDSYTAMVWSTTYALGCGYTACENEASGKTNKYYACVFGPAGNVEGHKIYEPESRGRSIGNSDPKEHSGEFALGGEVPEETNDNEVQNDSSKKEDEEKKETGSESESKSESKSESESAAKEPPAAEVQEEERHEPTRATIRKNPFKAKSNKPSLKEKVGGNKDSLKRDKFKEFDKKESRKAILDGDEGGKKMFRKIGSDSDPKRDNPKNSSVDPNNTGNSNTTLCPKCDSTKVLIDMYAVYLGIILAFLCVSV